MRNLNERVSKLEQTIPTTESRLVMLVQMVTPGVKREITKLESNDGSFKFVRKKDESEDKFIERVEEEVKTVKLGIGCAFLLLDDSTARECL